MSLMKTHIKHKKAKNYKKKREINKKLNKSIHYYYLYIQTSQRSIYAA